jgi:cyclopropane fatty-acyl-phospholipid synthase-like methyltransferase
MISKLFFALTNNIIFNNLLIWFRLDAWMVSKFGLYKRIRINRNASVTEMAGFSQREDVVQTLEKVHATVDSIIQQHLKKGDRLLDIGCGAGAYLKAYEDDYEAVGIDIHEDMIAVGRVYAPKATFILNDIMDEKFTMKFKFIFSIGVLEFIPPSRLSGFLEKIYDMLEPGGIMYLNYPHSSSKKAMYFPDLYYVEYSPQHLEKKALRANYSILEHQHVFDGRKLPTYDPSPYSAGVAGFRTFKNGYNLIAQKAK